MDLPFDATLWRPTRLTRPGDAVLTSEELASLSRSLVRQTKDTLQHPYDPAGWCSRERTLRKLGYPELALGDAHKAALLCNMHLGRLGNDARGEWRLGHGMGFWMQEERPEDDGLRVRLMELQERARKLVERNLVDGEDGGRGEAYPRPYPWLTAQRSTRSDELITRINEEFVENAKDNFEAAPYCHARRHAFGETGAESRDVLGVFASRDMPADTVFLVDQTRILGCCGPGSGGDLSNLEGKDACGDPVHPNLPDEDTDMDLRWVRDETGIGATATLLTIRLLLAAVQDGYEDPFDHPLVARFTPNYRSPTDEGAPPDSFYLVSDIDVPWRALQQFGIDTFANQHYDTWVLFTVLQRQSNNTCGDSISGSLMPLFSLFNHSCEPNVEWSRFREKIDSSHRRSAPENGGDETEEAWSVDHGTVALKTVTDVSKGEQLFVEYDSFEHHKPVAERRLRLRKWLSGDCMCGRCVREAAAEAAKPKQEASDGGEVEKREWDHGEEVRFPEDEPAAAGKVKFNHW